MPKHTDEERFEHVEESGDEGVEALAMALEEATLKYQRALADFQNFQRRSRLNEEEARRQGIREVMHSVITTLDHFDMALSQDPEKATVEQILHGVTTIRDEIRRALERHGLAIIDPTRDEPFNPERHEAVVNRAEPGVHPGHVVAALQVGYMLEDRVIRPAKVVVAPAEES